MASTAINNKCYLKVNISNVQIYQNTETTYLYSSCDPEQNGTQLCVSEFLQPSCQIFTPASCDLAPQLPIRLECRYWSPKVLWQIGLELIRVVIVTKVRQVGLNWWEQVHPCAKQLDDKLGKASIIACAVVEISSFISGSQNFHFFARCMVIATLFLAELECSPCFARLPLRSSFWPKHLWFTGPQLHLLFLAWCHFRRKILTVQQLSPPYT